MRAVAIPGLDPATYERHSLHREAAAWPETNCYLDLWIELLHALRLDPAAMLPFCFLADFEGDQWTFLKPPLEDLYTLYGVDVQELNLWDRLTDHVLVQVGRGNIPLVEVDAYYLPDTHGVSYRAEHVKTGVGINAIDLEAGRMAYFHNAGYFEVAGEDFRALFALDAEPDTVLLPPYTEFAKLNRCFRRPPGELLEHSLALARRHLRRRPDRNPFVAFRERLAHDAETLLTGPECFYHRYAFATLRQVGTAFQTAASYCRWVERQRSLGLEEPAAAFDAISDAAKSLLFKMARSAHSKRPLQYEAALDTMEAGWQRAFPLLDARLRPA